MDRIIYEKFCGGVAVVIPAPAVPIEEAARAVPEGTPHEVVRSRDLPGDRYFRDAWTMAGREVGVDMEKARAIHMGRIRSARNRELTRLDIEQLKGVDVSVDKQRLRDLPATFDLTRAATPDDLKALWPENLRR